MLQEFGKSVVSSILSKHIESKSKKVLLVDYDFKNNTIYTVFNVKRYKKDNKGINIIKVSSNLSIYICKENTKKTYIEDINLFKNLKKEYDYIIIDTQTYNYQEYVKELLNISDKILFLIESNISEIKKSKNILEIFINDFKINIGKIKIIFNKASKYKIADEIEKEIFLGFDIVGNIKYNEKFNLFINKNTNEKIEISQMDNIYKKI